MWYALKSFLKVTQVRSVCILSDNTTMVAYVNKMGGHEVTVADRTDKEDLVLVHGQTDGDKGSAPPRQAECDGRLSVQTPSETGPTGY